MSDLVVIKQDVTTRSQQVRNALKTVKDNLKDGFFDMCDLLLETLENDYHLDWGFTTFGEWVEEGSELDISARQAFYLLNISRKAAELGLSKAQLRPITISNLKEIFSLEPGAHAEEMKDLVQSSPTSSLQEVKAAVNKLKAKAGEEPQVYMTLKLTASMKELADEALELAKLNYGEVEKDGEFLDPSTSQCMELIFSSYVQDVNNHPQEGV